MILSVLFFILEFNLSFEYMGESFPLKYLWCDTQTPRYSDVDYYLRGLDRMLGYFSKRANDTEINRALGTYFMKAILKRALKDNKNKLQVDQLKLAQKVIMQAEDTMSHFYAHSINPLPRTNPLRKTVDILKNDDLHVDTIGKFKRNRFQKWIRSEVSINDFEKAMDELELPKEIYLQYTQELLNTDIYTAYTMHLDDSDYCLSQIIHNPMPRDTKTMKPCVSDKFCSEIVYRKAPSFSYSLSHRMLIIMMFRQTRHCYLRSSEDDATLLEALCSSMYREAVYLARRGYFNRDLWMEHIALCGLVGYEEFFRRHWFRKVVSWIDERGCLAENFNYEVNRSRYIMSTKETPEERQEFRKESDTFLRAPCHWHPMALSMVVLAHGVRHALHYSEDTASDEL